MIKAAFFDIDGTLVNFGAEDITAAVRNALIELRRNGVRVFLATGRPPYFLPDFLAGLYDGALCFNGAFCFDSNGVLYRHPLDPADVARTVSNARKMNYPVALASGKRYGSNFRQKELDEYFEVSRHPNLIIDDYDALMRESIYQMMIAVTADLDAAVLEGTSTLKMARWWDKASDIISVDVGKGAAIENVIGRYGIKREETMAFGDGGNDTDMIEYAGIGVAMGNASPEVQNSAGYIADSCAADGVCSALKHFGLI